MFKTASLFVLAFICLVGTAMAQQTLTNSDVLNMSKSGISENTIVLSIQQSGTKFDTSPEALIELKKEGVSDNVLNAMLVASPNGSAAKSTADSAQEGMELFDKALNGLGPRDKVNLVHGVRWKGSAVRTTENGRGTAQVERIMVYPDKIYFLAQPANGLLTKVVVTPEFDYQTSGKMMQEIPGPMLEDYRSGVKMDLLYMAQHPTDYAAVSEGKEQIGNVMTVRIKITAGNHEVHWNIDPTSGRLLRSKSMSSANGETTVEFSDWRAVEGLSIPFKRHSIDNKHTTDISIEDYELNPSVDPRLFEPPAQSVAAAFTFKVLQSESVPYVVQTGGGVSTSCNISGSTSTTMSAYSSGNMTFGTAESTPNLRMNCNSSENSIRWQHVLNAMLVEASDGNAYIIACDRAWRWSKCSGLKPGDTFNARRTDKGFMVQFLNARHDEKEATYQVLQAKSLR